VSISQPTIRFPRIPGREPKVLVIESITAAYFGLMSCGQKSAHQKKNKKGFPAKINYPV
jgi:hypothetical protein